MLVIARSLRFLALHAAGIFTPFLLLHTTSHAMLIRVVWRNQGLMVDEATAASVYERGDTAYRLTSSGLDAVDFLLAAGPAEPLRPLAAVASGGESARIMMALKAAPAAAAASLAADGPTGMALSTATQSCLLHSCW